MEKCVSYILQVTSGTITYWNNQIQTIIPDRVLRTCKYSGVHRILKNCKQGMCVSAVNTRSQNSVRNNS